MPIIKVAGRSIDVDVKEELMQYEWRRAKFTEDKIIACSPFRDDTNYLRKLRLNLDTTLR